MLDIVCIFVHHLLFSIAMPFQKRNDYLLSSKLQMNLIWEGLFYELIGVTLLLLLYELWGPCGQTWLGERMTKYQILFVFGEWQYSAALRHCTVTTCFVVSWLKVQHRRPLETTTLPSSSNSPAYKFFFPLFQLLLARACVFNCFALTWLSTKHQTKRWSTPPPPWTAQCNESTKDRFCECTMKEAESSTSGRPVMAVGDDG